jgi:hypothetical protein
MSYRFNCFVVLPDPDRSRLLLIRDGSGWALPHIVFSESHFGVVEHVNRAVLERFGIPVTILRCLYYRDQPDIEQMCAVYLAEAHDIPELREGDWVDISSLNLSSLVPAEHIPVVEAWMSEAVCVNGGPVRPPWSAPGWYAETVGWMEEQLQPTGRRVIGPVEQLRLWQRCCLLRAQTNRGEVYLKAVWGPFGHEPALTRQLAALFPASVPQVLAADAERELLITAQFAGTSLDEISDVVVWQRVARRYAELQVESARDAETWLRLGCPDRRLAVLAEQIGPLLTDTAPMLPGQPGGLTPDEIARIQALGPVLAAGCTELGRLGLPATLSHGDLCPGNITITARGPLFFDWSDTSLAHPFLDLEWLLHGIEERFPSAPDIRDRLRDEYLEPWTVFAPLHHLREAFAVARPLSALHHALTYTRYILPRVDTDWEMADLVPFFLRMAITAF